MEHLADKENVAVVISLLPPYEGKSVLELGASNGHYTSEFAKRAEHVTTLDFNESLIRKNESINGHHKNVKFLCSDFTSLNLDVPPESMDLIFSNQWLIYLKDKEVENLAERMVKWLKVGGYIFLREACLQPSEDQEPENNPTHYREPRFYTKVFKECNSQDDSGKSYELSLVVNKHIGDNICWIWQRVSSENDKGFQSILDNILYKNSKIPRYERVFGPDFISPGGIDTAREIVAKLDLQPGQKVLDVCCGIGGAVFHMAETYNVHAVGIDLSVNMISVALERAISRNCSVEFEVADCTKKTYPDGTFDVIHSRDSILHVHDKPALFRSFYKWLKPGGKVLITDYCKRPGPPSAALAAYVNERGYHLPEVETYGQMLRDAGFDVMTAEDITDEFIRLVQKELDTLEKDREAFIRDFSEEGYEEMAQDWKGKLSRSLAGDQKWGFFLAKKN